MRALLTAAVLLAALIARGTAQLSCKLRGSDEQPSLYPSVSLGNSPSISLPLSWSSHLSISPPFKHAVGPDFSVSAPSAGEGQPQLVVRLSAPLLTQSFVPEFTGRIEVDVAAEDNNDGRRSATFGKHCLTIKLLVNKVLKL